MHLCEMHYCLENCLLLRLVSLGVARWDFSVFGGPREDGAVTGPASCAWILSISGQEIRKGKVWDKRKQAVQ